MNRLVTKVALAAAAAMTISLASPVAAQASASTDSVGSVTVEPAVKEARTAAPSAAAPSAAAPVSVSGLRLYRSSVYRQRVNYSSSISSDLSVNVALTQPNFNISRITADLYVNGVRRANLRLPTRSYPNWFLTWSRSYGPGTTQLRNVVVRGWYSGIGDSSEKVYALPTASNSVVVKRAREYSSFWVTKRGSKLKFSVTGYRAYKPNGSLAPKGKAILQRKVGKKWKKVKKVKIRKSGKSTVKYTQRKKYKYRIIIKSSRTVDGMNAVTRKKI